MTRVFKDDSCGRVAGSGETEDGSAETQPSEGYPKRGCVNHVASGASAQ